MTTTSYKVRCVELTQKKREWLQERIKEYARIYNEASKYIPSIPEKYLLSPNPSELNTRWIKQNNDNSQLLQSSLLNALQKLNALKDACSNYKTRKQLKQKKTSISFIDKPNIIKFENSEYSIYKKGDSYGIHIGNKTNGIWIPVITNSSEKENKRKAKGIEWGIRDHLDLGIQMTCSKKERDKYLARKRKEYPHLKREPRVKAGLGVITYNLRDNTFSIPYSIDTPRFKKKETRNTFIGIDRGFRNSIVLSAVFVDPVKLAGITEYQELFNEPVISQQIFKSLKGLNAKVVGVKIVKSSFINDKKRRIHKITQKRQENRKEVGHRYQNISETVSHQISAEAVQFISQFRNPVVFFEDLNMDKKKKRYKHGKRNKKSSRRMLSKWDYGSIRRKIEYKLEKYGIWTMGINPMFTSQTCSRCGAIGIRDGIGFKCDRCGLGIGSNPVSTIGQYNADVNASINIALKGLFVLYGQKVGNVVYPNEQPDENVLNPIPTEMIDIEGINTRRSEIVAVCPEIQKTGAVETNRSRSTLCGSAQPMVKDHQQTEMSKDYKGGCAPENGFSSCYKGKNNLSGRTKFSQKTSNSEVMFQTDFQWK
jgi:IS605 OrfB family transposase